MLLSGRLIGWAVCWLLLQTLGCAAQDGIVPGIGFDGLLRHNDATPRQISSWDRFQNNNDYLSLAPQQTVTILDLSGSGVIQRFWLTTNPNHSTILRKIILRMYWDGEENPSVEVSLAAFFGTLTPAIQNFVSMPIAVTSGGFNCYWPMPFSHRARWTITNFNDVTISNFYYNIGLMQFSTRANIPKMRFHAQWRYVEHRIPGTHLVLDAKGQGNFAGLLLNVQARRRSDWEVTLEGNEKFYFDGAEFPSMIGTGTEDYFSAGWYFKGGAFSAPFHGLIQKDDLAANLTAYRWHIPDPIPFKISLRVELEHGTRDDNPPVDYMSTAFYYQMEPHESYTSALTAAGALVSFRPPQDPPLPLDVVQAENLVASAKVSDGIVWIKYCEFGDTRWQGGKFLAWNPRTVGAELTLEILVPAAGRHRLIVYPARASYSGKVQFYFNSVAVGSALDLNQPETKTEPLPSGAVDLGDVYIKKPGLQILSLKIVGKTDPEFAGVDIDAFYLKKVNSGIKN